jgi:hypothetical protein
MCRKKIRHIIGCVSNELVVTIPESHDGKPRYSLPTRVKRTVIMVLEGEFTLKRIATNQSLDANKSSDIDVG